LNRKDFYFIPLRKATTKIIPTIKETEKRDIVVKKLILLSCSVVWAVVFMVSPSKVEGYYNIYPLRRERD